MYNFFPMLSRMKYINRWGLMRNTRAENLSEHSLETAIIAHALALIKNKKFGGNVNPEKVALVAMFHDCSEIITGDLPTPIKYHNKDIIQAYKNVENLAINSLCSKLPDFLKEEYLNIKNPEDAEITQIVKSADKLSALIKCIEEKSCSNKDFIKAEQSILEKIESINAPEVKFFLENVIPSYRLSIDEY